MPNAIPHCQMEKGPAINHSYEIRRRKVLREFVKSNCLDMSWAATPRRHRSDNCELNDDESRWRKKNAIGRASAALNDRNDLVNYCHWPFPSVLVQRVCRLNKHIKRISNESIRIHLRSLTSVAIFLGKGKFEINKMPPASSSQSKGRAQIAFWTGTDFIAIRDFHLHFGICIHQAQFDVELIILGNGKQQLQLWSKHK